MSPHFPGKQHQWPKKYIRDMVTAICMVPPSNLGIFTRSTEHDK